MKVLFFDCFSGISGDMTLGALLDLGIDSELFKRELDKLKLPGYEIIIEKKFRNAISCTNVNVILKDEHYHSHEDMNLQAQTSHSHIEGHHHDHGDNHHHHSHHHEHNDKHHDGHHHDHHSDKHHKHHDDGHHHGHKHHGHHHDNDDHGHHHSHHGERNLVDIEALIDFSELKPSIKDLSKKVFREIAGAEAKVHNKGINEVHFHEVGAIDSIVDIVGTAICLDLLGIERVYSSPLHDGTGFIECRHGIIPVPVPAVMEMLKGSNIPLISEDVNTELVTPTGMGIIKSTAVSFGKMPAITIDRVGYGMGKRETGRFNALRVVMGSLYERDSLMEEISILETNIDDMSPEILAFAMEKLFDNGALDVFCTPVYMKKNRPAVILTVLSRIQDEDRLVDIILRETSTLGIRKSVSQRFCMDRKITKVNTEYGDVRVKIAARGDIRKFAPEYEDCREIAKRTGIPIADIYNMVGEKSRSRNI